MPDRFPVTNAPEGNMTEQMFLTDLVRWGKSNKGVVLSFLPIIFVLSFDTFPFRL